MSGAGLGKRTEGGGTPPGGKARRAGRSAEPEERPGGGAAEKGKPVYVDAAGGDRAPEAPVRAALAAVREGVPCVLVGPRETVEKVLDRLGGRGEVPVEEAPEVIEPDEPPVQAVQKKPLSSLVRGIRLARRSAFVSAGSTGALMAAGLLVWGRIPGVKRPAIAGMFPTLNGRGTLVLDLGANMNASPLHLYQYAVMGVTYLRHALGRPRPRVGLLNVGTEEIKGNEVARAAFRLLKESPLDFAGNVEGRDIFSGEIDVVVCDGFVGNVVLKTLEGMGQSVLAFLRRELSVPSLRVRLGVAMLGPALRNFARLLDYREYGGAPLLGLNGVAVKCHGSSDEKALLNGIRLARRMVVEKVNDHIREGLEAALALRAGPGEE